MKKIMGGGGGSRGTLNAAFRYYGSSCLGACGIGLFILFCLRTPEKQTNKEHPYIALMRRILCFFVGVGFLELIAKH